jgi:hypothetical protein
MEDKFVCDIDYCSDYQRIRLFKKIIPFVQDLIPDIMSIPDQLEEGYNNIIYYDENNDYISSVKEDGDYFEKHTKGAFIFCTNLESLRLVRNEILSEIEKDQRITFNLITTGAACTKIMEFLKEDQKFENCIHNVCIYCFKIEKYIPLKKIYSKIYDIYTKRNQVSEFIQKFTSKTIKPFRLTRLITYKNYVDKYIRKHFKVSTFYGHSNYKEYQKYISEMHFENNSKTNKVFGEFLSFHFESDLMKLESLNKSIIKR